MSAHDSRPAFKARSPHLLRIVRRRFSGQCDLGPDGKDSSRRVRPSFSSLRQSDTLARPALLNRSTGRCLIRRASTGWLPEKRANRRLRRRRFALDNPQLHAHPWASLFTARGEPYGDLMPVRRRFHTNREPTYGLATLGSTPVSRLGRLPGCAE